MPVGTSDVERDRRPDVADRRPPDPRGDAGADMRVRVARLPRHSGKGLREPDDVLAGAAGDFERRAVGRQDVAEYGDNSVDIAPRGRRVLAVVQRP